MDEKQLRKYAGLPLNEVIGTIDPDDKFGPTLEALGMAKDINKIAKKIQRDWTDTQAGFVLDAVFKDAKLKKGDLKTISRFLKSLDRRARDNP